MSVYLSPVTFSVTTIVGGSVSFSFKVPGTYGGLIPNDPTAGRYLQFVDVWADTPTNGDKLTGIKLTDTDGILSAGEQALCPNYPDVILFYDPAAPTGTTGGYGIHNNPPLRILPFNTDGTTSVKLLPSGLYLVGTFTAGDLSIGKVFRGNINWGRWLPV